MSPAVSDSMRQVDELIAQAQQCENETVLNVWRQKARERLEGSEIGEHIGTIYAQRLSEIKAEAERKRLEEQEKNPGKCGKHGIEKQTLRVPLIDKIIESCPLCRKEEEEQAAADKERRVQGIAEHKEKTRKKAYHDAMVPDRFLDATLENYEIYAEGQEEVLSAVNRFLANWNRSTGIVFIGSNGTGKNHLAAAIVKRWVDEGRTALMTKALKIFVDLRDAQNAGGKIAQVIKKYADPSLLIVNELGVQHGTVFERNYLTDIIDDRYEWLRPTILIGNVTKDELAGIVGERIRDRFKEGGGVWSFTWDSYRGRQKETQRG